MSLETTLADIIATLLQGWFTKKQTISPVVVLLVLQEQGWDNLNNVLKKAIIPVAAEIAGLTFGRDIIVEV